GAMNPKWAKWAHRVFLAPLIGGFGRSCLIPNLSYLSEAAASLLDRRLQSFIVPRTEVVSISSPTFFYSWLDLRKPSLPPKPGSFQLFCHGFQDASIVLKQHPWPGHVGSDDPQIPRNKSRPFSLYRLLCGHRRNREQDFESQTDHVDNLKVNQTNSNDQPFKDVQDWCWTHELMEDFREEMEKLVILDYLMRNTDRGLDNFMIKVCNASSCQIQSSRQASNSTASTSTSIDKESSSHRQDDYRYRPHCHVAAIDNSLAFPHHHPNGWRSYAYGWLFLPASLIGQPFSHRTRKHYLPILTSPHWWAETVHELRKLFGTDPDFNVKMFERQIAVIKGQAWNIVESLKHEDEGPLELCRRKRALVWDDPVEIIQDGTNYSRIEAQVHPMSAPAGQSYFSTPPMTIGQCSIINGSWSPRAASSSKLPPRPLGPISHKLSLDGARGMDLMKRMEALEACQIDTSQAQVRSMSLQTNHPYFSRLMPHGGSMQLSEDVNDRQEEEDEAFDESDGLLSDQTKIGLGKDNGHYGQIDKRKKKKRQLSITVDKMKKKGKDFNQGNLNEDDDDEDGNEDSEGDSINANAGLETQIGVVERIEFVTTQPVFKNC
ncbi:hypothetical protein O181_092232, partial [Austropuccinia psidii MF-1]|nr:hypothetical protein [Austropuccinia psidii MF-1]